jgi:WD40 repeat protein
MLGSRRNKTASPHVSARRGGRDGPPSTSGDREKKTTFAAGSHPSSAAFAPLQHRDSVRAVAYSPDGKTVLTGSDDKTARQWDAATGRPIGAPLDHEHQVVAVAYSPDGKTVLTASPTSPAM